MAKRSNPKIIGGFVVGAIALLIVGTLAFGGMQFFRSKASGVIFFEGSLSGLDVGSPVTFRGVKIGAVTKIVIQYDVQKQVLHIPVFAEIEPDRIQIVTGERRPGNLQALIERGLRAQLQVQSLVTGQVSVDLDFHPETPVRLVGAVPDMVEVPSVPSSIDVLKANLASVLGKINQLPLDQISAEVLSVLRDADQSMQEAHGAIADARVLLRNLDAQLGPMATSVIATSDQANRTLVDAQKLVLDADAEMPKLVSSALQVLNKAGTALDQADATMRSAQRMLKPDSPLYAEINQSLQDLRATAAAIRAFAEYIQRNPNALLTGKK